MTTDEDKLIDIEYISLNLEYINEDLLLAYNKNKKKCWYIDSKSGHLIPIDYTKFFDQKGNLLN